LKKNFEILRSLKLQKRKIVKYSIGFVL